MQKYKAGRSNKAKSEFDVGLPGTLHDTITSALMRAVESELLKDDRNISINSEVYRFKLSYLKDNVLSKFCQVDKSSAVSRKQKAVAKWLSAEDMNRKTNTRLLISRADFGSFDSDKVFSVAQKIIRQIIGDGPPLDIIDRGIFTNGASTRVKRSPTAIADKYVGSLHASESALQHFRPWVEKTSPIWSSNITFEIEESSVLFTVPKNSEIDRVACKEPEVNMFVQRSVGLHFREKLKRHKIDLTDQSRNQQLARVAVSRGLATIDLSSASDLISTQLVYSLLPLDWFCFLDDIRVKTVIVDEETHELNMFSSMGNGFTFELETLVFFALSRAVAYLTGSKGTISVYGDDIIVPSRMAAILYKVFQFCGFKVNAKKSFYKGFFRESCGKHYYAGVDVTPFFIRGPISTLPDLLLFLNSLRIWGTGSGASVDAGVWAETQVFHDLWSKFAAYVPRFLHGGRDVGSNYNLITPSFPRKRLRTARRPLRSNPLGGYIAWLHRRNDQVEDEIETSGGVTEVRKYQVSKYSTWEQAIPLDMMWYTERMLP